MKALEAFYADGAARDGRRPECKACTAARRKRWYEANKEREIERVRAWQAANPERVRASRERANADGRKQAANRRSHLKRTFGITPEQYDEMLAAQGGGCAICCRPPRSGSSLHVDHDHTTGAIRALLCFDCNAGIGKFREDPDLLLQAFAYVLDHDAEQAELASLARQRVARLASG